MNSHNLDADHVKNLAWHFSRLERVAAEDAAEAVRTWQKTRDSLKNFCEINNLDPDVFLQKCDLLKL